MKRIVPYGIRIGESGDVEVVPVARAKVKSDSGKAIPVIFLVDSGATTTLLPLTDAEALGIELTSGEKISIRGISGDALVGYRHRITLELEGFLLQEVPITFASRSGVPRVLGREGFFPKFGILFDEARRRVGLFAGSEGRKVINRLLGSR